jgi:hypothetical protein
MSRVAYKTREKGLVDESTVDRAQEKDLVDKADEPIDKARNRPSGGQTTSTLVSLTTLQICNVRKACREGQRLLASRPYCVAFSLAPGLRPRKEGPGSAL